MATKDDTYTISMKTANKFKLFAKHHYKTHPNILKNSMLHEKSKLKVHTKYSEVNAINETYVVIFEFKIPTKFMGCSKKHFNPIKIEYTGIFGDEFDIMYGIWLDDRVGGSVKCR